MIPTERWKSLAGLWDHIEALEDAAEREKHRFFDPSNKFEEMRESLIRSAQINRCLDVAYHYVFELQKQQTPGTGR